MPWSTKSRAILLLPLWAVWPVQCLYKGALYLYIYPGMNDSFGGWNMCENNTRRMKSNGGVHTTIIMWSPLGYVLLAGASILIPRVNVIVPVWK